MSPTAATIDIVLLERVLPKFTVGMTPAQAEEVLAVDFTAEEKADVESLSARAELGTLSVDEVVALDRYLRVGGLLGLLQSHAGRTLGRNLNGG